MVLLDTGTPGNSREDTLSMSERKVSVKSRKYLLRRLRLLQFATITENDCNIKIGHFSYSYELILKSKFRGGCLFPQSIGLNLQIEMCTWIFNKN